jgi:DNA processing protein
MIALLEERIPELEQMQRYPASLYYLGNPALLKRPKISIVGSRKPTPYTKFMTAELASKLSRTGICIVSGAAMGVDAAAHWGALEGGTIAVMGNGLDIRYPATNRELISAIEKRGLALSQFEAGFCATQWSFVLRNEIVTALGEVLIVTQADLNSGSLRSVEFARKMGKKIYVLPHRIGESEGTNALIRQGIAEAIYDIDDFVGGFVPLVKSAGDAFLEFCRTGPTYEETVTRFGSLVYDYELDGKIKVAFGKIQLC